MTAATSVSARLASPRLLARLFSVRALAWLVIGVVSIGAGVRSEVPAVPAIAFGVVCLVLFLGDALWALQAWGIAPVARAQVHGDGTATVRLVTVKPAPPVTVRTTKRGDIATSTRRSLIGGAGLAGGWPTHEVVMLTGADGTELERLVPHGELTWTADAPWRGPKGDDATEA